MYRTKKILKATREKDQVTYKGTLIKAQYPTITGPEKCNLAEAQNKDFK